MFYLPIKNSQENIETQKDESNAENDNLEVKVTPRGPREPHAYEYEIVYIITKLISFKFYTVHSANICVSIFTRMYTIKTCFDLDGI